MNSPASLRVRVSADLADIKQGLGLLRGELSTLKKDANKALTGAGDKFEASLGRIKTLVGSIFAGVSAGALVAGIVKETGQAQSELAQLRAALKSTSQAAGLSERDLVSMADNFALATTHSTGQIIDAQTRLLSYSGIAANEFPRALQLAINQSVRLGEDLTQSAETVGKALEYPAEGVSALTKQGFRFTDSQKKLLKELEKTGRLAEAQAIVMAVMEESYDGAAEAARNTLPGAFTALRNAMSELLDGNGGRGARQVIAAINSITEALRSPQTRAAFSAMANDVLQVVAAFAKWLAQDGVGYIRQLVAIVSILIRNLDVLAVAIGSALLTAALRSLPFTIAQFVALRVQIAAALAQSVALRGAMSALGGPIGIAIGALAGAVYLLYRRSMQAKEAQEAHNEALGLNAQLARDSKQAALEDAQAKRVQAIETLRAAQAVAEERRQRLLTARESQARAGGGRGGYLRGGVVAAEGTGVLEADKSVEQLQSMVDDWNKRLVELRGSVLAEALEESAKETTAGTGKALAASNALLRDAVDRALKELDRLYEDGDISIADFFQKRTQLQERSIDLQVEQARAELAVTTELGARRKIEEQIAILQRDRADVALAAARDERKAIEDMDKAVADVYIRRLENEGKLARATRARLEEEYREQIVRLERNGQDEELRIIKLFINSEVAKAQLSQFEEEMSQTLARLQSTEQSLSAQQQAGMLGVLESERQIKGARETALEQLWQLRERSREFLATLSPDSPEAARVLSFLRQLDGDIAVVGSSMQRLRQQISDAAIDSVSNLFMDLVDGSKSAGEALRDFVRGFVMAMAQIAARALATFLVLQLLDAIYPGLGKATAATMSVGQNHDGGMAGRLGGVRREVSPLVFGAAPRYHEGGVAGLKPGEVPAILEYGERIRTAQQESELQRQLSAGQGGGSAPFKAVLVLGEDELANALAGAAGERVVVTHIRNNRRSIDE